MTSIPYLLLFLLTLLFNSFAHAQFFLISYGTFPHHHHRVRTLEADDIICPSNYPFGFNIECVIGPYPSGVIQATSIYINGIFVRTETNNSVFIGVDKNNNPCPWISYPSTATISCRPNGSILRSVSVSVKFLCQPDVTDVDGSNVQSMPETSTMLDVSMAADMTDEPEWTGDFEVSTAPDTRPVPGKESISPEVVISESPSSSASPSTSTSPSPSLSSTPVPSQSLSSSPIPSTPTSTSSLVSPPPSVLSDTQRSAGCIIINAVSDLVSPISNGWVIDGDGLTFRKWEDSETITNEGQSPLYYNITATRNSRFAVTVDMTTRKHAEHNDIWVRFQPRGFQGIRGEKLKIETGWVKGYHNEYGRATKLYTTDFDPHSLSTAIELSNGETYSFGISGRSSKLTVHRIVLFPCSGYACQDSDISWKTSLNVCMKDLR